MSSTWTAARVFEHRLEVKASRRRSDPTDGLVEIRSSRRFRASGIPLVTNQAPTTAVGISCSRHRIRTFA
jgi:hypothetical protein